MAIEIAKYTFTPWMRKGIAVNIDETDTLGQSNGTTLERATIPVDVIVKFDSSASEPVNKRFQIIGPGDIIGINKDMIIRTEPRNWITNFEPNYLCHIEFYDEDFAWRYTPATSDGDKLRPWLTLLVLKEDGVEFSRTTKKMPLSSIKVGATSYLPPSDQTWAWAHAHTNNDFEEGELNQMEDFLRSLNKKFLANPDDLYSRLISPRNLEPDTPYRAFLIPSFEVGRLAGLGLPTTGISAQQVAWSESATDLEFPIYHEWYFRTGKEIDFEYLIRLLEPKPMDSDIGVRPMDSSTPKFGLTSGTNPSVLGLEGALKSPTAISSEIIKNDFHTQLKELIDLPFNIQQQGNSEDAVVSVPYYGAKHAVVDTVDLNSAGWVHKMNTDPRTRVPAGFGTMVVQKNQERYMQKAWQQLEKVIEANKSLIFARLLIAVNSLVFVKTFVPLTQTLLVSLVTPVLKKIKGSPTTLYQQIKESRVDTTPLSNTFRKLSRPRGKLVTRLNRGAEVKLNPKSIIEDINAGKISAAPVRKVPDHLITTDKVAGEVLKKDLPTWLNWFVKYYKWIIAILIVIFLVLFFVFKLNGILGGTTGGLVVIFFLLLKYLESYKNKVSVRESLLEPSSVAEALVKNKPKSSFELTISDPLDSKIPTESNNKQGSRKDSIEAERFRLASINASKRFALFKEEEEKSSFNFAKAEEKIYQAINPSEAFGKMLQAKVVFPFDYSFREPENIIPAMAYPDIDEPMYEKLRDISTELLIPNLDKIPENTISLLETNQEFIESYMVGLNHEMGRELLWREYMTDERGSYFRQFWDVTGILGIKDDDDDDASLTEKYKDIKPIHTWGSLSLLGKHNNRDAEGDDKQVVFVIRGELLKKYPNTVIYAQKAHAVAGKVDPEIKLELSEAELKTEIKFPLYRAEIKPDIRFFGFDLTVEQTAGTDPSPGFTDTDGWYFIIQEAPGEPRFGMDISIDSSAVTIDWDDLSWEHLPDPDVPFIDVETGPSIVPADDIPGSRWGKSSANMAYILYQKPVMIAAHAKEMLL